MYGNVQITNVYFCLHKVKVIWRTSSLNKVLCPASLYESMIQYVNVVTFETVQLKSDNPKIHCLLIFLSLL